jgi:hypothetical protein
MAIATARKTLGHQLHTTLTPIAVERVAIAIAIVVPWPAVTLAAELRTSDNQPAPDGAAAIAS